MIIVFVAEHFCGIEVFLSPVTWWAAFRTDSIIIEFNPLWSNPTPYQIAKFGREIAPSCRCAVMAPKEKTVADQMGGNVADNFGQHFPFFGRIGDQIPIDSKKEVMPCQLVGAGVTFPKIFSIIASVKLTMNCRV